MKNILALIVLTLIMSCTTSKIKTNENAVDSKVDKHYRESIGAQYGTFNSTEVIEFYKNLGFETNRIIDTTKTVLITFIQKGGNCFMNDDMSDYSITTVLKNKNRHTLQVKDRFEVETISVYTSDSYANDYLKEDSSWKLDSGFFQSKIFDSKKNCEGFIIIKPNGNYYKYYGFDYHSTVLSLLEKKTWDFKDKF